MLLLIYIKYLINQEVAKCEENPEALQRERDVYKNNFEECNKFTNKCSCIRTDIFFHLTVVLTSI